jgi:hypothetical protein
VLTWRANGVQPFDYPPAAVAEIEALLPWNVKPILEQRRKSQEEAARQAATAA